MKNYYEILEVNNKASKEVIERAYRVLVKKYHPDLYMGEERVYAEQKIRDLNEAYKILSDDFLREQYDTELQKEINYSNQFNNRINYQFKDKQEEIKRNFNFLNRKNQNQGAEEKVHNVGTIGSMADLTKEIFRGISSQGREKKEIQKEDIKAAVLTAVIIITLGVILWLIPATRGFIRSLVPF